jgi:hypothetical protein
MKSAPTIAFDHHPSRRIAGIALAVALAAALAPWLTDLALPARGLLSLLALAFAAFALRRYLQPAFRRIAHGAAGWVLVDEAGREHTATLHGHARLGALLTLDLRHARGRFRVVLAPDNLDADTRRRLVLLLARAEATAREIA